MHDPNFNITEFSNIRNEAGLNGCLLSSKQWVEKTNAIGIISKLGRYGGTYACKDIAFEFGSLFIGLKSLCFDTFHILNVIHYK